MLIKIWFEFLKGTFMDLYSDSKRVRELSFVYEVNTLKLLLEVSW